jgi:formiminotetrahydrofolate cyclodeaminase
MALALDGYLEALASSAPTPGGGSAACVVGAAGAGLVAMVARITLENARLEAKHEAARSVAAEADALRAALLAARKADEVAYAEVVAAMAMPKGSPDEKATRTAALQAALRGAAAEPLRCAVLSVATLSLAERALALENANLASDLGCAAEFATAALAAAALNVRVNHAFIRDADYVRAQEAELRRLEREAQPLLENVRFAVTQALLPR